MSYIKSLKIGNVTLKNNILLAPMAGITDLPFRLICEKFEPGLVCTEMISAKGIYYNDEKTKLLMDMKNEKRPVAVQIFGSDIESMKYSAEYVSNYADIVDINMGCPAPKVTKNGDGSRLLLDLDLAGRIAEEVVKASKVPVTVKIRKGWDEENIVAVEAAKIFEKVGVSAITIHGRTRAEYYGGVADWQIIKKVKENVNIPVIGNGDVKNAEDVKRLFETANVDGIMIGRASLGNPWIFREIKEGLSEQKITRVTDKQRLDIILEHINLAVEQKGENIAIKEMRKHLAGYIKNMKEASKLREKINHIDTKQELDECLIEYFNNL